MLGLFGSKKNRGRRTVFLGVLSAAVFVWAAIDRFDVPPEDMAWLLLYCVIGVALTMLLAALCVGVLLGGKALLRKWGGVRTPPE